MPENNGIENANEITLFYSKWRRYLYLIIALFFMALGVLCIDADAPLMFGIVTIIIALYPITEFIRLLDKNPQLIINEKGIQIRKMPFYTWTDISDVRFESRRNGKTSQRYMFFWVKGRKVEIQIDELDRSENSIVLHINKCLILRRRLQATRDRNNF